MYRNDRLINEVVERIGHVEDRVLSAYESTAIEHEPQITDRLLGRIEQVFDGQVFGGVVWSAKTLTSQGANPQEARFGADFMGVLSLRMPGYEVSKGFLAQSKRLEPGQVMRPADRKDLLKQCGKMLAITPTSYVYIYSAQRGIQVASAVDVLAAEPRNPLDLTTIGIGEFFKRHFECHIGDTRIHAATANQLEALKEEYDCRSVSHILGVSRDQDRFA